MKSFQIEILTPRKAIYSGEAEELVLRSDSGYFGVLAGHAPLIARLAPGRLKVISNGKQSVFQAGAGFVRIGSSATPAAARGVPPPPGKTSVSILLNEIKELPVS